MAVRDTSEPAEDCGSSGVRYRFQVVFSPYDSTIFSITPPLTPVPFMQVLKEEEEEEAKTSVPDCETLVYANIRSCPIIEKRLGLRRRHGLSPDEKRGRVMKHALDDHYIEDLARFTIEQLNEHHDLRLRVRLTGVVGAWEEKLSGRSRSVYHIMVKASENGAERRFYAAISVKANPTSVDKLLMDWAALDSPRSTIALRYLN